MTDPALFDHHRWLGFIQPVGLVVFFGGRTRSPGALLYRATVTASRGNPVIKAFYQRLRAAGQLAKVALTACTRKLLTILNALLKATPPWPLPAECKP